LDYQVPDTDSRIIKARNQLAQFHNSVRANSGDAQYRHDAAFATLGAIESTLGRDDDEVAD
jgi:hypothetical protein